MQGITRSSEYLNTDKRSHISPHDFSSYVLRDVILIFTFFFQSSFINLFTERHSFVYLECYFKEDLYCWKQWHSAPQGTSQAAGTVFWELRDKIFLIHAQKILQKVSIAVYHGILVWNLMNMDTNLQYLRTVLDIGTPGLK